MAHDPKTDEVMLTMVERRAWNGGEPQLFELQEKFNAYLSFALDGELAETYPALADKRVRVRLESDAQTRVWLEREGGKSPCISGLLIVVEPKKP